MHPIHTYVLFELPWEQSDKTKLPRMRVTEFNLKIREALVLRPNDIMSLLAVEDIYIAHKSSQFVYEKVLETTGNFANTLLQYMLCINAQ